jgi:hypothetical protein
MRKKMKINVERVPSTQYTYTYEFTDSKGFLVRVQGIPDDIKLVERDIKTKFKKLSTEEFEIILKK